jgi:hypothetical protein
VPVEDLVHFEAGVLQKISYPELSACHGTYLALRDAWRATPEVLLAGSSPGEGRERPHIPEEKRNELLCDRLWGRGRKTVGLAQCPARNGILAGAAGGGFCLWDAWHLLQPEQHGLWKLHLLASLTIKARKAFGQGLLPLAWGRHARGYSVGQAVSTESGGGGIFGGGEDFVRAHRAGDCSPH